MTKLFKISFLSVLSIYLSLRSSTSLVHNKANSLRSFHSVHGFGKNFKLRSESLENIGSESTSQKELTQKDSPLTKIKNLLSGNGFSGKGFSKETLAQLGLACLLSYGFVSNFSHITAVIIAWCLFGQSTKLSPLAPGQWKPFLAIYAGIWAANNVIRPLRFSLSIIIAPAFEKLVNTVQKMSGRKRSVAIGIVVFLVNFCGTISYLIGGLFIATKIFGVPLLP